MTKSKIQICNDCIGCYSQGIINTLNMKCELSLRKRDNTAHADFIHGKRSTLIE